MRYPIISGLLLGTALSHSLAAHAEDTSEAGMVPSTQDQAEISAMAGGRVFTPADFTQFAPRNAFDMLEQVPGFQIKSADGSARGLGQADENVLINGRRFSSKSDSVRDQLGRIPAKNVVRIEIVEGATLDVPGLSGQVANVVVESSDLSGQFTWRGGFRPHNAAERLYGGEVSISGSSGEFDYTLSLKNNNWRFGADGPTTITDAAGTVIERQDSQFDGGLDDPTLSANLSYDFGGGVLANLNLSGTFTNHFWQDDESQFPVSGVDRLRVINFDRGEHQYEIGGDIEFPLGPGRLKLIGLEAYQETDNDFRSIDSFADARPDTGSRFTQEGGSGERIGRFEYSWNMWDADWQLSGEAAFNRLDRTAGLFELDQDGEFAQIDFPEGSGGVKEDRFEGTLSFSKRLTDRLALQATLGAEKSMIEQSGSAANSRTFQRPKGSVSLAWQADEGLDVSLEARRSVGQLSFGDFLAQVNLANDNQNGGNNELVPDQSWDFKAELRKDLGPWGSATVSVERRIISDLVDFIPLEGGGEALGNIDSARQTDIGFNSTVKFDPIGFNGAQLELQVERTISRLTDPLDGETRGFSNQRKFLLDANFRHDIPNSDWAYGVSAFRYLNEPYYRFGEIGRYGEEPVFADVFVEHKDVMGLTVNARAGNLLGARNKFNRTVFNGSRADNDVQFREDRDRRIGPIFVFSVSGNFK
jgi:hypothetical protein